MANGFGGDEDWQEWEEYDSESYSWASESGWEPSESWDYYDSESGDWADEWEEWEEYPESASYSGADDWHEEEWQEWEPEDHWDDEWDGDDWDADWSEDESDDSIIEIAVMYQNFEFDGAFSTNFTGTNSSWSLGPLEVHFDSFATKIAASAVAALALSTIV